MDTPKFSIGQQVTYTNGNPFLYSGEIKQVRKSGSTFAYIVIDTDDKAAVELWNAGFAIGFYIQESQIN